MKPIQFTGNFRLLVGHRFNSDPSIHGLGGISTSIRNTITTGVVSSTNGSKQGELDATGGIVANSGLLTVSDNDFTTGRAVIGLGDYGLISNIDFIPGVGVNATATAIAAAINLLPEFSAVANAANVTVSHVGSNEVEFLAEHYGTKTNFTLTPNTGQMTVGSPTFGAPDIT